MDGNAAELLARPRTRAECVDGPRPCPWVSCEHHALLARLTGGEPPADDAAAVALLDDMPVSCTLDVTDAAPDGATLDAVAGVFGVVRERVRQMEVKAFTRATKHAKRAGLDGDVTERDLDDVEVSRPKRNRTAAAFAFERAPVPPLAHHAHLPGPADVAPGGTFWCGHIGAAVTTRLCQGRRTATWAAQGNSRAPRPTYPACAECPDGAALAERLSHAPPAPERRRLPVLQPKEPTTMTTKTDTIPACDAKDCGRERGGVRSDTNPDLAPFCNRHRGEIRDRSQHNKERFASVAQALREGAITKSERHVRAAAATNAAKAAKKAAKKTPSTPPAPEKRTTAPVDGLALVRRMSAVITRLGGIDAAEALADELAQIGGAA
jgi:hypothetical protein